MQMALSELLVDHVPDALVATDTAGRVCLWNRAAQRDFGYRADEAEGQRLVDLIVPSDLHDDEAAMRSAAFDGVTSQHEVMRHRKDGVPLYVNCSTSAIRDAQGQVTHLVSHLSDVTRHRARRDAEFVHARFQAVLDRAPDAIVIVNGTGRIVLFNAQACTMFGHEAVAVLGEPIEMLLPERLQRSHLGQRVGYLGAPRMRAMGEGRELHGLRANGEEFPVEISLSPVETEAGRLVMSAIRDIGERKRFERALQEKNVELERASRAKDRFLATMSHELRTPLNAILGFSEVMKNEVFGGHANAAYKEYSADIHSSGQHLLELINEILDLSRIESGKYELNEEALSLADIAEDCRHMLNLRAKAKSQTIREAFEPDLPRVWADERAIRQVVLNILSNAIKFTPPGGEITVKVGWTANGGQYVSITDTGPGIPEDEIPIVLQTFGRGSLAIKTAEQGSGLGLPIVKGLIDLHGGGFNLKSKPRAGTEVTVTLPPVRVMDTLAALPEPETRAA